MKPLFNIYFILILTVYILVRTVEYFLNLHLGWISNYATDLCCMPITLCVLWFLLIKIQKKEDSLPFAFIALMTAFWAFYFEFVLPKQTNEYTADWLDVICYFIGALSFVGYQNFQIKKSGLQFK